MTGFTPWGWMLTVGRVARQVWLVSGRTHMGLIAAGVAFYGMFALFPGMAALIAIFGLISDPGVVQTELQLLDELIPQPAYELISAQLERLLSTDGFTLTWTTVISLLVALWSARAGVSGVVQGLNAIYDLPQRSGFWHEVVSVAMTLILMFISISALLVVVVAPILTALFPPYPALAWLLEVLRWGSALFILIFGLWMIYTWGPNRRARGKVWLTPGAVVVVLLWCGASAVLSSYFANFGSYNEVYGSIGAVIALLMWLWVSAYLILAGAAVNAVIERISRARDARDRSRNPL